MPEDNSMDFLERLTRDVLNKQDYYTIVISPLFKPGNSIAVVPMPGNEYDHYFDGSYIQHYAFQVMTKHETQLVAYQTLQNIVSLLTSIKDVKSNNDSYSFEGIELTTDPNIITKNEKHYEFAAQFSASLYIKNKE